MGQIVSSAAKPKRCNLNKLSQLGIPAAGEYILVSSDNSMNAAGQGNFDCYIEGNGRDAATSLPLIKTYANDVDDEPTAGSDKLVKSGGVYSSRQIRIIENANVDFSISDEFGHSIVEFSDGHIKTKDFNSLDAKNKLSTIEAGAEVNDVCTNNEEDADLMIKDEEGNILTIFYDGQVKTKNFDSKNINESNLSSELFSVIKPKKDLIRRTYFQTTDNTYNFLQTNFNSVDINTAEQRVLYDDNCVLYLPNSYSASGKPSKLIIFCKQGASTITEQSDQILDVSGLGKIFRYMLRLGYAIMAADGVPNGWATALGLSERVVGNYVAVQSTIKAYNYVCENYNIDTGGVFIFGYSQGGHYAQNVIDNSNIPINAAAEISPACSMRWHQWDLASSETINGVTYTRTARLNIARMFNYPAVSTNEELLALEYDPTKTVGYDPWTRNVENPYNEFAPNSNLWKLPNGVTIDDITMVKHIKCPLKVWCADNDSMLGSDVMKVFVKAIKNAGQVADIQCFTSGGHDLFNHQDSIGSFTENGDTLSLYPIAQDIASWFNLFGGYELV